MKKILFNHCAVYQYFSVILGIVLLTVLCFAVVVNAQQPTATINSVSGGVLVSIQGKQPVAATVGAVLQSGDTIQTQAGAQVVLKLSEGSELRLGQRTKLDLAALLQQPQTGARTSRIKLAYGTIRASLSAGHQKEGSSFTMETPNAVAGVKFSHPEFEVSYDPETATTIIIAYTVEVIVTNLLTNEVKTIPPGSQAIIRGRLFEVSQNKTKIRRDLLLQTHQELGLSGADRPATVGNPGVASHSGNPEAEYSNRTVDIHVRND
jgi:hypothetical protein